MAVQLSTSAGPLVVDLMTEECPLSCKNFLKLCKSGYYNGCLFWNVQSNYLAQTGDPTGTGKGGESMFSLFSSGEDRHLAYPAAFINETNKKQPLNRIGLLCMAHNTGSANQNRSQFFITLRSHDLKHLEGKHTVFGEVAEGHDILEKINKLYTDSDGRPFEDFRIKRADILDDPFEDPLGFRIMREYCSAMYIPPEETVKSRIYYQDDQDLLLEEKKAKQKASSSSSTQSDADGEDMDQAIKRKEAKSRAIVLEMTGDLPDADVKPPEEALFVCKLNPVTNDEDLELIFSRFGKILKCSIIRDELTGDSLCYAFVEFFSKDACVTAYKKMNNVLIDDRRIKVDFSQSVTGLWNKHLQQKKRRPCTGTIGGVQNGNCNGQSHGNNQLNGRWGPKSGAKYRRDRDRSWSRDKL